MELCLCLNWWGIPHSSLPRPPTPWASFSSLAAGSYVALTVLGRPPGLPQIPLEEDEEAKEERGKVTLPSSISVSEPPVGEQENFIASLPDGVRENTFLSKKKFSVKAVVEDEGNVISLNAVKELMGHFERLCGTDPSPWRCSCAKNTMMGFDWWHRKLNSVVMQLWDICRWLLCVKAVEEENSRTPRPKLEETQDTKRHVSLEQELLSKAASVVQVL